jgi:hypothetical protein
MARVARSICGEAASLESALEAELWASALLGSWWPPPLGLRAEDADADLEFGGALVDEIARQAGPAAAAALIAIGEVSETQLGVIALRHAEALLASGAPRPAWGQAILAAEVLRTVVVREDIFDDGITIFVEAAHADGEPHAVGVYIDHNLGVMAKDILLAESIDRVEELIATGPHDGGVLRIEPIPPVEAGARIHAAMELTDMTLDAPVGEDYARLRALALLRADELPGGNVDISLPEVTPTERERLLSDFLASPHANAMEPDGDHAMIVSLAIDFCADYVDGRPLRWSPVVVELFMADWLPRKLLAERATFGAVPTALDAWIRYAGATRDSPDWAIEQTAEAITEWADEMLAQVDGGRGSGPAKEFLAAADAAGLDLSDEQALAAFISGWNARSERA